MVQALQAQNAVVPSEVVEAGPERIAIRVSGGFTLGESLKAINFRSNNRFFRLSDIAQVKRGYVDPPQPCSATTASRRSAWRSPWRPAAMRWRWARTSRRARRG